MLKDVLARLGVATSAEPFDLRNAILVGFGYIGISIVGPIINYFLPIFLQAGHPNYSATLDLPGLALSPAVALFIMTWDNILNVFVQPWVGAQSDRTRSPIGRRKPWVLLGVPIAVVFMMLIPQSRAAWMVALFVLLTNFGLAIFRSPAIAWLGDLFPEDQRSRANGIVQLMGGIAGLLAFLVGGWLFDLVGLSGPFVGGAVLLAVVATVAVVFIREPEVPRGPGGADDEPRLGGLWQLLRSVGRDELLLMLAMCLVFIGFFALEAGLSSYAVLSLGLEVSAATRYAAAIAGTFIVFAVPAGYLGNRIGRKQSISLGLVGLVITLVVGFALRGSQDALFYVLLVAGVFWSAANVNGLPLMYDYSSPDRIGGYTGLYYLAIQIGAVLGPTLLGVVVQLAGGNYEVLWIFCAVAMTGGWVVLRFVRPPRNIEVVHADE